MEAWMNEAQKYIGQHEVGGHAANPFILQCFQHTDYHAASDEVPWCAAFICKILEDTGHKSTHSAAANSYLNYGEPCELKPGAILVFHWPHGGEHVTFCHDVGPQYVGCLGGNQSNAVDVKSFPRSQIVAIRWPVK